MSILKKCVLTLLLGGSILSAGATDYLIKNGNLYTLTKKGYLATTDLLIKDGKIAQIGQGISVGSETKIIDAKGKMITPGLINASTQIGLVEIGAVSATVDSRVKDKSRGASFDISPAINFNSTLFPQNRINGLTRAIVLPGHGDATFNGQGAAIALLSSPKALTNSSVVQVANYGSRGGQYAGGSRAAAYQALDTALTESAYLQKNDSFYKPGMDWRFSQSMADLRALWPVIAGREPLLIEVNRASDILQMLKLAKKHQIRLIIGGGAEAWMVANDIAQADVPVLMDPLDNIPHNFDSLAVRADGAALLAKAGVKLIFTGQESTHNGYLVRQSAGNAVAYGLDKTEALKAMTRNTAEVFGLTDYGTLEVGKSADIVVWDGDPLELTSNPDQVFIEGERQPMVSRATRLRDRFWDLSKVKQAAYRR